MPSDASRPAAGVPFWTPAQEPTTGAALDPNFSTPTLFKPLTIRGVTLPNRFAVSPMCMYSSPPSGHLTDYHLVHIGQFALNGAGLVFVEAIAVQARGRITPSDAGIWDDSHVGPLKRVVDFVHSQGHLAGVQLAHAGRKASTYSPWLQMDSAQSEQQQQEPTEHDKNETGKETPKKKGRTAAGPEVYGWPDDVFAPSAIKFDEDYPQPKEMSLEEIKQVVEDFKSAAKRAIAAGFDVVEIHAAHGYLLTSFLSPISNTRTDKYGGSFENRTRVLFEVIAAVRSVIPESTPLFVRVSATEWMSDTHSESLDLDFTIKLAKLLPAAGVDLIDVSSGGNNAAQQIPVHDPRYQLNLAREIRKAVHAEGGDAARLLVGAVGRITTTEIAKDALEEQENGLDADLVLIARQFLRDPAFVRHVAQELKVNIKWPVQYHLTQPDFSS